MGEIVAYLHDGFGGEFPLSQSQLDEWNKVILPLGWVIFEVPRKK